MIGSLVASIVSLLFFVMGGKGCAYITFGTFIYVVVKMKRCIDGPDIIAVLLGFGVSIFFTAL